MRNVLAVLAGLVMFFLIVTTWQGVTMPRAYPLPEWADPNDMESIKRALGEMPAGAFGLLLAGYALATACGGAIAGAIGARPRVCALVVGGLTLLGGVLNFMALPHPAWAVVVGVLLFPIAAVAGGRVGEKLAAR